MQSITIAGRIGKDAKTRQAGNDNVTSFTVAVDQRNGREKITNWWRVSVWGKRGDALAQYLTKGASVTVVGEFTLGEYDGKPQLNVRANEIALQGGKSEPQRGEAKKPYDDRTDSGVDLDDDLDSIPF